jgi:hypothetical protein
MAVLMLCAGYCSSPAVIYVSGPGIILTLVAVNAVTTVSFNELPVTAVYNV